ncbi:hypothetical protein ABEH32_22100 [Pantoea agglomerans]|jgi:hypothetical protein|uniref:hypothetical protein n=1 Tax=Enterobacter agglomerans TaxID=549 RepID=UPI0016543EF9|nr:hypothetical protein [Pantoea agglomerans]
MKISTLKIGILVIMACMLSGCGTLGSKLYDSGVEAQEYNDTKQEMLPYKKTVILAKSIYGNYSYITDEGRLFFFVADVDSFNKDNVSESMRPLIDFLNWAKVTGPEKEKQRVTYNLQPNLIKRHIEFRYFPDGSPAFVDVYNRDSMFFLYKSLIDTWVRYYNYEQVKELVLLAYSVTNQKTDSDSIKTSY